VTEYLELEDLLEAAAAAIGHPPEVRDIGLLQGAVARPAASAFGEGAYPGLDQKAAALLHSIVTSHPLADGNKRLGWVATRLFYRLNGTDIRQTTDEAFELVIGIADGSIGEVTAIADRLTAWRQEDKEPQ
jgi:death-on-curing protein